MNNFVKMDVAIEIMADKISKTTNQFLITNDLLYKKELSNLITERNQIYAGNINIIDKVINVYGEELKFKYAENKNVE